jgi:hypothetical protein
MSGANAAAQQQASLATQQYQDWKQTFGPTVLEQMHNDIDTSRRLADTAIASQNYNLGLQKKYDDRYWGVQVPLEDSIIQEANRFDTDGYREQLAGQAGADVRTAFGQSRDQMDRDLAARGIDPSSPAAMALRRQAGTDEAAAAAAAMNKTRVAAEQMGWSKKLDAASLAKGLPGFSSSSSQLALGWNGAGLNGAGQGLNAATTASGASNAAYGGAISGFGGASANLRANAIESAKNPGFDAVMGLAAGGLKLAGSTYGGKGWSF